LAGPFLKEAHVLEFGDIQGIVFSGYQKKPFASYLMLRVTDPGKARGYFRDLAQCVTTGADRTADTCINVAITAHGLTALGLDDDALATFPLEFREGLAGSETRSRALGDIGDSSPGRWVWGGPDTRVHVLLMLYARTEALLSSLIASQRAQLAGGLSCEREQSTQSLPDRREHFGFADGIAQPVIEGGGREDRVFGRRVKAGEFILGYENEYGKLPFLPNVAPQLDSGAHLEDCRAEGPRRALGRNGSYLVVRQMDQDVHAFWSYMRGAAAEQLGAAHVNDGAIRLAAKSVGRWPSGAPLVSCPQQDDPALGNEDDFGYFWKDRHGTSCPLGAHIRRANPRDSLEPDPLSSNKVSDRHRIMRRGRAYGEPLAKPWLAETDDGEQRGLMFICVNTNIRRQFEFIQQTWINNPKFSGLYDEVDPLIGGHDPETNNFSIPDDPTRCRLEGLPRFVQIRGGDYFFLPSVRALRFLASLS
jgi:Dyp-type peroxidase family